MNKEDKQMELEFEGDEHDVLGELFNYLHTLFDKVDSLEKKIDQVVNNQQGQQGITLMDGKKKCTFACNKQV